MVTTATDTPRVHTSATSSTHAEVHVDITACPVSLATSATVAEVAAEVVVIAAIGPLPMPGMPGIEAEGAERTAAHITVQAKPSASAIRAPTTTRAEALASATTVDTTQRLPERRRSNGWSPGPSQEGPAWSQPFEQFAEREDCGADRDEDDEDNENDHP